MNWFEAFSLVDERIKATDDVELLVAWNCFLQSPFPHIWGCTPPAGGVGFGGETVRRAHLFLETADEWNGRGVELLLFRLVQAMEGVVEMVEGQMEGQMEAERDGRFGGLPRFATTAEPNGRGAAAVWPDEAYQRAYCDDCGSELGYNGMCFDCELKEFENIGGM